MRTAHQQTDDSTRLKWTEKQDPCTHPVTGQGVQSRPVLWLEQCLSPRWTSSDFSQSDQPGGDDDVSLPGGLFYHVLLPTAVVYRVTVAPPPTPFSIILTQIGEVHYCLRSPLFEKHRVRGRATWSRRRTPHKNSIIAIWLDYGIANGHRSESVSTKIVDVVLTSGERLLDVIKLLISSQ